MIALVQVFGWSLAMSTDYSYYTYSTYASYSSYGPTYSSYTYTSTVDVGGGGVDGSECKYSL